MDGIELLSQVRAMYRDLRDHHQHGLRDLRREFGTWPAMPMSPSPPIFRELKSRSWNYWRRRALVKIPARRHVGCLSAGAEGQRGALASRGIRPRKSRRSQRFAGVTGDSRKIAGFGTGFARCVTQRRRTARAEETP